MEQHAPADSRRTQRIALVFALVTLAAILLIGLIVHHKCDRARGIVGDGVNVLATRLGAGLQADLTDAAALSARRQASELAAILSHLHKTRAVPPSEILRQLDVDGDQHISRYLLLDTNTGAVDADSGESHSRMPRPISTAAWSASRQAIQEGRGAVSVSVRIAGQPHQVVAVPLDSGSSSRALCLVLSTPSGTIAASVPRRMHELAEWLTTLVYDQHAAIQRGISGLAAIVVLAAVLLLSVAVWMVVRNERVLAESEERYRELIENALVAVAIYRGGRIRFVNSRMAEMLKYEPEDLIGRRVTSIVHPENRSDVRDRSTLLESGREVPARSDIRLLARDGSVIWGDVWSRRLSGHYHTGVIVNIIDVTERRKAKQRLMESQQKFRTFTEKSLHPIWVVQGDRIGYCNSAFAFYVGLEQPSEAIGQSLFEFIDQRNIEDVRDALERVRNDQAQYQRLLVRFLTVHKTVRWHDIQFARIEYESEPAILASGQDVTELKLVMEELNNERLRDGLTGLYNRRYLKETVLDDPAAICSDDDEMTVLSVDVDRLKAVNDTFGHAAGDVVLREVADVLSSEVRRQDTVIRVGGDEFIVLMPSTTPDAALQVEGRLQGSLRRRLRDCVDTQDLDPEIPDIVGLSGGVARFSEDDGSTIEQTLREADRQMYARKEAKKTGRRNEDLHPDRKAS